MSVYRTRAPRSARTPTRRAAFYDLDGTLVDLNLVHMTLFMLANLGEWGGRAAYLLRFAARAPRLYVAESRDRRLLNIVLFEAFRGVSRDRLFSLGEEYFERVLIRHCYPQALEMVEANRAAGLEPVLVTGSPDFVVTPLARHLGSDEFAANRLIYGRGRATGRLAEPIMAGEEKAEWCSRYAGEHGIDLADCWGYADSHYDMPFLAALGHPVAVNPNRQLRAAAMSRHWPIIHFDRAPAGAPGAQSDHEEFVEEPARRTLRGAS
jgi:HAD superfamily hydrolase (TIGR01490 family)